MDISVDTLWFETLPPLAREQHEHDFKYHENNLAEARAHLEGRTKALMLAEEDPELKTALNKAVTGRGADVRMALLAVCAFIREPVPGEVDTGHLVRAIKNFHEWAPGSELPAKAWVHPSIWAELARDGDMLVSEHGVGVMKLDGHVVQVIPRAQAGPVDLLRIKGSNYLDYLTYIPPRFLLNLPGGSELYQQTRGDGLSQLKATQTVVDALRNPNPVWPRRLLGPDGGARWVRDETNIHDTSHARVDTLETKIDNFDKAVESTNVDEALMLAWQVRDWTTSVYKNWQHWSEMAAEPTAPKFDPDKAMQRLLKGIEDGQVGWRVRCRPQVYLHLAPRCHLDSAGTPILPSPEKCVMLQMAYWPDEDTLIAGLGAESDNNAIYLPPSGLTPTQADAYEYARSQGMCAQKALECAQFAGGEESKTIPVRRSGGKVFKAGQ